jgi:hypothetical protein
MAQASLDLVPDDGATDCLRDDETGTWFRSGPVGTCRIVKVFGCPYVEVHNDGASGSTPA